MYNDVNIIIFISLLIILAFRPNNLSHRCAI
jgi:hypothetical protein